jgi:ABC-type branched-subunit amino acid transport system ATPase component
VIVVGVERVSKRCGRTMALSDVSLDFEAGKLTAILGPSGCGKTTLLRAIAGFAAVDSGVIRFDGADVTGLAPALWPHMTVFDNVAYSLDEFTGRLLVGAPFVTTLPVDMYTASVGYELQIASVTALVLMLPGAVLLALLERFLRAEYLAFFGQL